MKYVQTVRGAISPHEMGFTLPHEHVFWNLNLYLPKDLDLNNANDWRNQKITLENLGEVRNHFQCCADNVVQQELNVAVKELRWYKEAGGGTICDCTVRGLHGDPTMLKKASELSGINIVLGSGYYCCNALSETENRLDKYEKAEKIVKDLREGIGYTDIRAGFIKVGVENSIPDADEQSLAAAAIAQKQTGAAILIHQPGIEHKADHIFNILTANGADLTRTVMCHCDPLLPDHNYIDYLAKAGAYISFDFFGLEAVLGKKLWLPTDKDRIFSILVQIERGNIDKLLISHDTIYKTMLRQFGGYGYAHIQRNMWPLMLANGYTKEMLEKISVSNPMEVFSLGEAKTY